ncbi:MAG TPA: hypothetical protein DCM73_09045 [Clostridiales bacterium]|nr:hypothetical protein [Clostridiales bacterium]
MKSLNKFQKTVIIASAILILIIIIGLFRELAPLSLKTLTDILDRTKESYTKTIFVILLIYTIKPIVMVIPLVALYIATGMMFPAFYAVLISYAGLTIEMTIGFFIGRRISKGKIFEVLSENKYAGKIIQFGNSNSIFSSFVVRVIKGPPADLTSIFMGSTGMSYPQYILGTLLGVTPGMIPVIFMGRAVDNPLSAEFIAPLAIYIVFLIITFLIFKRK